MISRLYNNGTEVRVDLHNTGETWPACKDEHRGFPWLTFGAKTWEAAEEYARSQGATTVIFVDSRGFERGRTIAMDEDSARHYGKLVSYFIHPDTGCRVDTWVPVCGRHRRLMEPVDGEVTCKACLEHSKKFRSFLDVLEGGQNVAED